MYCETHLIVYSHSGHTWMWSFNAETSLQAMLDVVHTAARPDTPFRWLDAAKVCSKIRKGVRKAKQEV